MDVCNRPRIIHLNKCDTCENNIVDMCCDLSVYANGKCLKKLQFHSKLEQMGAYIKCCVSTFLYYGQGEVKSKGTMVVSCSVKIKFPKNLLEQILLVCWHEMVPHL